MEVPIISRIISKLAELGESDDWRNLKALPREVISKRKLDSLQSEVLEEINKQLAVEPQAVFYCHKYIDAKFNKTDFDVDTYFLNAQNEIDRKYAEGIGELLAEFADYKELIQEIKDDMSRMNYVAHNLTPNIPIEPQKDTMHSYQTLEQRINDLPPEISWQQIEEKLNEKD